MRKKIYIAAGYNTLYYGPGRPEFDPTKPMPPFEHYLKDTAKETAGQLPQKAIDEGIIGSFMSGRFIHQANLPGFLPYMLPELTHKPCTAVEGACGTGGRALAMGMRSVLSEMAQTVFVAAFEMQNTVKSVYGADVLAGAAYYKKERKSGQAFFFPGLFSDRAEEYCLRYGHANTRQAMARWYEQAILNARKNPKAQEYHNQSDNLYAQALANPDPEQFIPFLNLFDCSKITDGASSLMLLSEEGASTCGVPLNQMVEIVGIGEAQENITEPPLDQTVLSTTGLAARKALQQAGISHKDLSVLEIHDCFSITALLALEAIGFALPGEGSQFILDGHTGIKGKIPTNLSGGLIGFGHPTGASGVRQMVDLLQQLTYTAPNQAEIATPYGMMISMGGNDKTVTAFVVKQAS